MANTITAAKNQVTAAKNKIQQRLCCTGASLQRAAAIKGPTGRRALGPGPKLPNQITATRNQITATKI